MKKRIIIVGGGIHGISCATALSDLNYEVMLLDKKKELFQGTSGSTHNRAHMGYHYPRAAETVKECLDGLELFQKQFKGAFVAPSGNYYAVSKVNSKITSTEFASFCDKFHLPYQLQWPDKSFLIRDNLCSSFFVPEVIFDIDIVKSLFNKKAMEKNILVKRNTCLLSGKKTFDDKFQVNVRENGVNKTYVADLFVNATYAYSNNILQAFGMDHHMKKYKLQIVEVAVVRSQQNIPGLTIMDGPFISLMPYGNHPNLFLTYDVEYSVNTEEEGYILKDFRPIKSKWPQMQAKGRCYFPFMDRLEYVTSLKAYRPIPLSDRNADRSTKIKTYDDYPGFYSLLEGKFISALTSAERLREKIVSEWKVSV